MAIVRRYARTLAFSAPLAALLAPGVARADLTAAFADTLTVDPAYLTGANGATDIAFHSDGRAVVTQKNGQITIRRTDGTKNVLMGTFSGVDTASEKGLLGVVSDSNDNFYFYVSNGSSNDDKHRVYKGTLSATDTLTIDMTTPIIAASRNLGPGLEGPANHDGGGLFIHDNMLFVGVGDTGANSTPPTNKYSSCLNKGNGKVLRVNLDGTIPASNPLVGVASVTACDDRTGAWTTDAPDERIFAWGFRNPWRVWVDPVTDLLWVGDVGETTREEVSVGAMGSHFGYPFNEGTTMYGNVDGKNCNTDFSPAKACTPAATDWARQNGYASVGGLIPQGCGWTAALGDRLLYVFADFGGNWLHALEVESDRSGAMSSTFIDMGSFTGGPVSIRQGPDEGLYVVFNGSGSVTRFIPTDQTGADCNQSVGGAGGMGGMGGSGAGTAGAGAMSGAAMGGNAGDGMTAGTGGVATAGTGGMSGTGGAGPAGTGGMGGTGGSVPTAGTNNTSGQGGSAPATGGMPGTGGASGGVGGSTAGTATAGAAGSGEDGGCGCRVAGTRGGTLAMFAAALAFVVALGRRRSRR